MKFGHLKSALPFTLIFAVITVGVSFAIETVVAQTQKSPAPKSQWGRVYSQAQSKRGETLYSEYCTICHGEDLMGGEMAPPLTGGQFQSNWNELSLGDLFERMRVSMPLTAPGSLSRQQIADILSYMLSKSDYPAGQNELPTQADALNAIKFIAAKP